VTSISNQLSYTPIQPPAEPKARYPVLTAVVQRVAFAILIAGFSAAFGVAFALSVHTVSLLEPAITWAIFGTLGSMPLLILGSLPTPVESYRQGCLDEMLKGMNNPRARAALKNLKNFFYYPLTRFRNYHQLALLYNEIAAVTEKLDRERRDVIQAWAGLLKHLHGLEVKLPGGERVQLDLAIEFSKLQGRREQVKSKWLTTRFVGPDRKSLEEIEAIESQTLGRGERFSAEDIKQVVQNNRNSHIIVAHDAATQEIVGFGWYFQRENVLEIASLARKPTYARLGIGSELLAQMLQSFDQRKEIQLYVRKSNEPAIRLYQKWGFKVAETRKGYYKYDPPEDGYLMKLDWEEYNKAISQR